MRWLCAAFLILSLAGCHGPTDPEQLALSFDSQTAPDPSATVVEGGLREITVRGSLTVGQGGYELRATALRSSEQVIQLEVTAHPVSHGRRIFVNHRYDAVLQGLAPGVYTLRVVHDVADVPGAREIASEETVRVGE